MGFNFNQKAGDNGFMDQSDSDDDNNFHPPVLSKYALELLEKEEVGSLGAIKDQGKIPKNVSFKNSDQQMTAYTTQNTIHTNQSDVETIFTKTINQELHDISSTSQPKTTKNFHSNIPLNNDNSNNEIHYSQSFSRSAHRRLKPLGSLGPPKRAARADSCQIQEAVMSQLQPKDSIDSSILKTPITTVGIFSTESQESNGFFRKKEMNDHNNLKHCQSSESPNRTFNHNNDDDDDFNFGKKQNLNPHPLLRSNGKRQLANKTPNTVEISSQKEMILEEIHQLKSRIHKKPPSSTNLGKSNGTLTLSSQIKRLPQSKIESSDFKQSKAPDANTDLSSGNDNYIQHYFKQKIPLKSKVSNSRLIDVNGKLYEKLELLGKGGSSKVFKVKSKENKVYAIKKICLDDFETSSIIGFRGEIDLLKKLRGEERVVKLIDESLDQGSLLLVMECGDIDLSQVLQKRLNLPLDFEFVRYHSNELLKCVRAVHDAGIVHSDLKPANFLFVKGMLKIIDFGIANAVPDHTMNIYRDSQIGTPNYMAPEALIEINQLQPDNPKSKTTWKVGKPADVWSCGCIIYQMVYGRPPYGGYQGSQRLFAIMNQEVKIEYPNVGLGNITVPLTLMQTIQQCLVRDPTSRASVDELLNSEFCRPRVVTEEFILRLVENALDFGSRNKLEEPVVKQMANDVWRRLSNMEL